MSSTNKTEKLKLNQWVASDKPKRSDFNYDNEIIDTVISDHLADGVAHIGSGERELWNECVYSGIYFGDGTASKTITFSCPFTPQLAIVFANGRPLSYVDFDNSKKYNYCAIATRTSSSANLSISSDTTLSVTQDISASFEDEYTCLNQSAVAYTYVLIR